MIRIILYRSFWTWLSSMVDLSIITYTCYASFFMFVNKHYISHSADFLFWLFYCFISYLIFLIANSPPPGTNFFTSWPSKSLSFWGSEPPPLPSNPLSKPQFLMAVRLTQFCKVWKIPVSKNFLISIPIRFYKMFGNQQILQEKGK